MRTWPAYRTLWLWLLLGWTVSAADRSLTGPVVTWMIQNKVAFLAHADNPFALGGLIGGLFFAGVAPVQPVMIRESPLDLDRQVRLARQRRRRRHARGRLRDPHREATRL